MNTTLGGAREAHLTDTTLWSDDAIAVAPPMRRRLDPRAALKLLLVLTAGALLGGALTALAIRQRHRAAETVMSINGNIIDSPYLYHRLEMSTGSRVVDQMIAEELQLQYARKLGAVPSEAEVAARFKEVSSKPDFPAYLASTHQTVDDVKRDIRVQLARVAILGQGVQVTEGDIRDYYRAQCDPKNPTSRFYTPESVRIAIIVTNTETECKQALQELSHGAAFGDVARKVSRDTSKENGGEIPVVYRGRTPSSGLPGIEKAVFGLETGQQTGPRKIGSGWWIIRCLEKSRESVQPFDSVREECRIGATVAKSLHRRGRQVKADFEQFRRDAKIAVFWPQYRDFESAK